MYKIVFTSDAQKSLQLLEKKAPMAVKKLKKLLEEIAEHPRTGTGQVERVKHYNEETWSRRINHEHRIIYRIYDETVGYLQDFLKDKNGKGKFLEKIGDDTYHKTANSSQ